MAKIIDFESRRRKHNIIRTFEKYRSAIKQSSGLPQIAPILKTVDRDFREKNYQQVISNCRQILAANNGIADIEVYFKMAFSLYMTKQFEAAQEICYQALDRFERKGIFFNFLGDLYLNGTHPTNFRQAYNFFHLALYHARQENDPVVGAKALTSMEIIKTKLAVFQKLND
jgi:tetratricopeptide (TPR) repeat protein